MHPDARGSGEIRWEALRVPAGAHTVPVRVYRPEPDRYGWLVWAPGGSWQAASVEHWHETSADLARTSGCTVVSVGYRLAPRHQHPAQLEDVLTVMDWARRHAAQDGEPRVLSVGGDSAGGTLAAAAALVWRDRREPLAAQVLAYPPLDPACGAPSYTRLPDAFPSAPRLRAAWRAYRGNRGVVDRHGERLYSTPLEADRFDRLAPAVVAVGELDPVIDDVTAYALRLSEAGNEVALRIFPGTPHAAVLGDTAPSGSGPSVRHWLGTTLRDRLTQRTSGASGLAPRPPQAVLTPPARERTVVITDRQTIETAHIEALKRHFGDLRDGTHGDTTSRSGKERHFKRAVELLGPYALQVLAEFSTALFYDGGVVKATGLQRTADAGLEAAWTLSWPEQRDAGIAPITLMAHFGRGFHHPHLRGATVQEWPLNVFTEEQAAAEVPVLRAIATADLHNLVFQRDYRIVPAIVREG